MALLVDECQWSSNLHNLSRTRPQSDDEWKLTGFFFKFKIITQRGFSLSIRLVWFSHYSMTIQNFIFSNKMSDRLARHLCFWFGYAWLFHFQNDNRTLLYLGSFLPACVLAVYLALIWLMPLLKQKRYIVFSMGGLVLFAVTLWLNYFTSSQFFYWSYQLYGFFEKVVPDNMIFGLALHNQTIAMSLGGIAIGIKATKDWYIEQKQTADLEKLKALNELKLEKANLYPKFIFQALNSLQRKLEEGADESPVVLMKLSDTLSYILYDSQVEFIELKKELAMVMVIIEFKKLNWAGKFTINHNISGDPSEKFIVPLTLFRLIENLFQIIENEEEGKEGYEGLVEVQFKNEIGLDYLFFQLMGVYSCESDEVDSWKKMVDKIRGRLNGLYFGACEFNVANEECMYSISLKLRLTGSLRPAHNLLNPSKTNEDVLA